MSLELLNSLSARLVMTNPGDSREPITSATLVSVGVYEYPPALLGRNPQGLPVDEYNALLKQVKWRELTANERNSTVFSSPTLRLKGIAGEVVEFRAADGSHFSLEEVLDSICETERQTRHMTFFDDGIDDHHVYFEGIRNTQKQRDVWEIIWGS